MSQADLISATPSPVAERANPFKGLAYYEERDAGRFAGRQRDIETVVNGILRTRTFVVYGRSGLGKTSLLLAGVFPKLTEQGCFAFDVRLLEDPLSDLRRALVHHCGLGAEAGEEASLPELIERACRTSDGKDRLLVIAFDQFEEFFVRFADQPDPAGGVRGGEELDRNVRQRRIAQREAFIQEVGRLAADVHLNLRLVFSLREDWIAEMADFADVIPEITHHMYRLVPLTSFGVRQAIVETLRSAGSEVDNRLVAALIDALTDVHFDPIVLQVLSSEVWERAKERSGEGELVRLEPQDLEAIGGVRQVFRTYLDQVNNEIESTDLRRKILTCVVLEALISEKRTKLAVSRELLLQQSFIIAPEELDEVLNRLYRHRLVRSDPRGGVAWFELVHERLVGAILEWFEVDPDFFKFRNARNLVLNSCRNLGWKQNPELLLNRGQLDDTVGQFKELLRFNNEELLYLVSSAVYAHSRDLEYWAELAGQGTSDDLIERFLDRTDSERTRRRAAEAAGRIAERREHFAERCLDLALHDPSPQVRHAAARSFADLASPNEFKNLAKQLREKKNRSSALDVLTEVADKDRIPREFKLGRRYLWQARRRLYRRRLDSTQQVVRERSQRGAFAGIAAAFAWSFTVGSLLVWIFLFEFLPEVGMKSFWYWPLGTAIYLLSAIPLGGWTGWNAARNAAKAALRSGREGLPFWSMIGKITPITCGLLIWLFLRSKFENNDLVSPASVALLGPASVTVISLWLALLARVAAPTVQPVRNRQASWIWAWAWAFGGSLSTLPLLAIPEALKPLQDERPSLLLIYNFTLIFVAVTAIIGGILTYSRLLSVAYSLPIPNNQEDRQRLGSIAMEPVSRTWIRKVLGLSLALTAFIILFNIFGLDSLPLLAHRMVIKDNDISRHISANYLTDTFYFKLIASSRESTPRLVGVSFPEFWQAYSTGSKPVVSGQALILQPGESRRIALDVQQNTGTITFRPDHPTSGAIGAIPFQDTQFVVARFSEKGGIWSRTVPLLRDLAQFKKNLYVSFGETVQGGAWCKNSTITLYTLEKGDYKNATKLACASAPQQITFGKEVIWAPVKTTLDVRLKVWRNTSLPHGKPSDSIRARWGRDLNYIATVDYGTSDQDAKTKSLQEANLEKEKLVVYLWPLSDLAKEVPFKHPAPVIDADVSWDERWLVTVATDKKIRLWRVGDSSKPTTVWQAPDGIERVFIRQSYIFAETSNTILILDIKNPHKLPVQLNNHEPIWTSSISRDGSLLTTGGEKGNVRIWNLKNLNEQIVLRNSRCTPKAYSELAKKEDYKDSAIYELRLSPAGDQIVAASLEGTACIWRIGAEYQFAAPIVLKHKGAVSSVAFSKDGARVLTASYDGFARIWTVRSPTNPKLFRHKNAVNQAAFSSDESHIVTGTEDGTVHVWNVDGSDEAVIQTDFKKILGVRFTPDGQRVLSVPDFGPVQVWDISQPLSPMKSSDLFLFLRVSSKPLVAEPQPALKIQ